MFPPIMLIKDCFHEAQTKEETSTKPEKSCIKIYCLIGSSCSASRVNLFFKEALNGLLKTFLMTLTFFLLVKQRSCPEFLSLYEHIVPLCISVLFLCGSSVKTREPVGCLMWSKA